MYFFGVGVAKISVAEGSGAALINMSIKMKYFLKLLGVAMWGLAYIAWSTRNVKRGSDSEGRLIFGFTLFSMAMLGMAVYSLVHPPFMSGGEDAQAGFDKLNLLNYPILTFVLVLAMVGIRRNTAGQSKRARRG